MKKIIIIAIIGLTLNSCEQSKKKFTCDDPELKKLMLEKVGTVQNVKTTSIDEENQTCNCEGFAPDKVYNPGTGSPADRQFGVGIEYKAQRKESGEIEVEVLYMP